MKLFERYLNPRAAKSLDLSHWGYGINDKGHLQIDGCDVVSIAKEFKTPVHVVAKSKLIDNCHRLKMALQETIGYSQIFYSYKTNCVPGVLELLHQQGFGAEVISPYELWLAFRLGIPGEDIIFNGPHKTRKSLEAAVRNNVKLINVDSLTDLTKLLEVCKRIRMTANVGVRLCPIIGWNAQFGLDTRNGEAVEAFKLLAANSDFARVKGVHFHLGSQIGDVRPFIKGIKQVVTFLRRLKEAFGIDVEYLDVGGGLGVPTVGEVGGIEKRVCDFLGKQLPAPIPRECASESDYGKAVKETVDYYINKYSLKQPQILFEPGRIISSSAQILLLTVKAMKKRNPPIAVVDGGRMNIAFPTAFEYHEVFVANKMNREPRVLYRLVGRTCTPADLIYSYKELPTLDVGDIISIMDSGAYFSSFSNNFAFPRPSILLADNGHITVLRDRETFYDLLLKDQIRNPTDKICTTD